MLCGRVCSGKTTFSKLLQKSENVLPLSLDSFVYTMLGSPKGSDWVRENEALGRKYLCSLALEALNCGCSVSLDFGFWYKEDREEVRSFFQNHGFETVLVYFDISAEERRRRLKLRNESYEKMGEQKPYCTISEEKLARLDMMFVPPDNHEPNLIIIKNKEDEERLLCRKDLIKTQERKYHCSDWDV